ncbi:MAG: alpha/beta hydrolase [Myxococcota bacterium]|nr:alpha/beta hydrolase [Myxococcota bacterium]
MTTETLKSSDGTAIHVIRALASEPARGDILLCHGANEYMGRYTHVIEALNRAGYNVHGMDLRGHGHSGGRRGHVQRWVHYSEDMRVVAQSVGRPLVILAHSMGGLVTLECMREGINGVEVHALMISNPLLALAFDPPALKAFFAKIVSRITPGLLLDNELNPDHLSHDTAMNEDYVNDPLVTSKLSPRWFTEMNAASERVQSHASSYTTPLLLMQGTADPITSAPKASEFFERYGGPKTCQAYEGLYHEIFNEVERDTVISAMIDWLNNHMESR